MKNKFSKAPDVKTDESSLFRRKHKVKINFPALKCSWKTFQGLFQNFHC